MTVSEIIDSLTTLQKDQVLDALLSAIVRCDEHGDPVRLAHDLIAACELTERLTVEPEAKHDSRNALMPHQVERVLASNQSSYFLAREYGCAPATIRHIRQQEAKRMAA